MACTDLSLEYIATRPRGSLVNVGVAKLGHFESYEYFRCVECSTDYPRVIGTWRASCNGHDIVLCPWCREDSAPGKYGRGA